jgi:RP/EB family microtubule-associated protein
MKCKFQDNLEFMQWVKRFWDQNFPGGGYDAVQRRKGGGPSAKSSPATGRSATSSAMASRSKPASTINSPAGSVKIFSPYH